MYNYTAVVRSIYDGDTIRVDIDLGFGIWTKNVSLRLSDIDTPEIRGEERASGLVSKQFLLDTIPAGTEIQIHTMKDRKEKYGRYLATIYLNGHNLNEEMVQRGLAEKY